MAKFEKGKSGNPAGRKPGAKSHVSKELERIMKAGGGKTAKAIAEKLVEMTLQGNTQAAKLLLDRVEGRVKTAEELAKLAGANEEKLTPEQNRAKLVALLRQPEMRSLIEESLIAPKLEIIQ
jgi:Family of unknown function (DUF5681)